MFFHLEVFLFYLTKLLKSQMTYNLFHFPLLELFLIIQISNFIIKIL